MTGTSDVTAGSCPPGREETWKSPKGLSGYEASDNSVWRLGEDGRPVQVTGGIRSLDRTVNGRFCKGRLLKARIMANSGGYLGINVIDDEGVKRTMLVHRVILLAHDKPCPDGMETRHSERGPLWNRFPEDICWGTKEENEADKPGPSEPTFECVNHARCGGFAHNPGRRCVACVAEVGRAAARMIRDGMGLQEVAEHFGYTGLDWVYKLAVQYGGYEGTRAQARMQDPVRHQPCICPACTAPQPRGLIGHLAATLRGFRRKSGGGDRA